MFSAQTGDLSGETSGVLSRIIVKFVYPDFNAQTSERQLELFEGVQSVIRAIAHVSIFLLLGFLLSGSMTFGAVDFDKRKFTKRILFAFVFSVIYAISDEVHQYFVPDRTCELIDLLKDSIGAAIGCLIVYLMQIFKINVIAQNK